MFNRVVFLMHALCLCLLVACASVTALDVSDVDVWWGVRRVWRQQAPHVDAEHSDAQQELARMGGVCRRHVDQFIDGVEADNTWAIKVWDTSGHYPGQLYAGDRHWLGSLSLCSDLNAEFIANKSFSRPPFPLTFYVATLKLMTTSLPRPDQKTPVNIGLCLPKSCSLEDIQHLLNSGKNFKLASLRHIKGEYQFWNDTSFSLLMFTFFVVGSLMIAGTWYDLTILQPAITCEKVALAMYGNNNNNGSILQHKNNQTGCNNMDSGEIKQANKQMAKNPGQEPIKKEIRFKGITTVVPPTGSASKALERVSEVLKAFSVPANVKKICSLEANEDTLTPLHGLRVISILWVIMIHTCLVIFHVANNKLYRSKAEEDFLYHTLSSGTFSVDTFFFVSGLLISFLYFRTRSKFDLQEFTKQEDGLKGQGIQFSSMIVYRFFRLTPPYLIMIWIVDVSMKHFRDHSVLEFPSMDYQNCENYWWRNILYINTMFPSVERCMSWSWYLANDSQFYVIGAILLIISKRYFHVAAGLVSTLFVLGWGATAVVSLSHKHITDPKEPLANYDELYDKPWARIGPYLVGLCTGWLLFHLKCTITLSKTWVYVVWSATGVTLLSVVYGLHYIKLGPTTSAMYVALCHTAWALALAWVVIACVTGYGGRLNSILSWKYLYPFSRLTYCVYLIHPQLMRSAVLAAESPMHISRDLMIVQFLGFTVASYMLAFVFSLSFEAPCISLLKMLHPQKRHKNTAIDT
ncbi:O-acyltransferase like protein isoform X2 [Nilaparvata lugens]|uniref:O-acyltransferase like protein isoform X2 n=1 Tax=Nilaparvata lugens TaxID=108931 RepID=UPI00193E7A2D|nr:O-acyltransferase like protein isoform X2 [Nilaparvata lugens]